MTRFVRELRLIPIAVVASACLLVLTAADLLLGRSASVTAEAPATEPTIIHAVRGRPGDAKPSDAKQSWAREMFNFPDAGGNPPDRSELALLPPVPPLTGADKNNGDIITGSVPEGEKPKDEAAGAPAKDGKDVKDGKVAKDAKDAKDSKDVKDPPPTPNGTVIPLNNNNTPGPSAAERAVLERLQERRQELDKRARELDIREGLIAEAEKRIEAKLAQIKEGEAQLAAAAQKKDEAEAARLKGLVTMYENMKPRDAAKIFDRLEVGVLLEVASLINPRNMSEILSQMSPDRAEQLTVELANRAQMAPKDAHADLPKIEGRPTSR